MATKPRPPAHCCLPTLLPGVMKELPRHVKPTKKASLLTQDSVQKLFCKEENAFLVQERGQSNILGCTRMTVLPVQPSPSTVLNTF